MVVPKLYSSTVLFIIVQGDDGSSNAYMLLTEGSVRAVPQVWQHNVLPTLGQRLGNFIGKYVFQVTNCALGPCQWTPGPIFHPVIE